MGRLLLCTFNTTTLKKRGVFTFLSLTNRISHSLTVCLSESLSVILCDGENMEAGSLGRKRERATVHHKQPALHHTLVSRPSWAAQPDDLSDIDNRISMSK